MSSVTRWPPPLSDWKWLPNLKRDLLRTEEVGGEWTQERSDKMKALAARQTQPSAQVPKK